VGFVLLNLLVSVYCLEDYCLFFSFFFGHCIVYYLLFTASDIFKFFFRRKLFQVLEVCINNDFLSHHAKLKLIFKKIASKNIY
jgi:hypothetical protein